MSDYLADSPVSAVLASSLLLFTTEMPLITLKMLARRMAELVREYDTATKRNHPRAGTISEELDQLRVVYAELEKVLNLTRRSDEADVAGSKSNAVEMTGLLGLIRTRARQIAKTSRDDPARNDLVNEFTCLVMIAEKIATPQTRKSGGAPTF